MICTQQIETLKQEKEQLEDANELVKTKSEEFLFVTF